MEHFTVNLDCRNLRTEYLEGEKYLVAPVVLMTPDVHNGSKGALLYRKKELRDYAPSWNHKPIVLNHPTKGIACTQEFLNQYKMGIVLQTDFVRGKQRSEAWFNERRTAQVAPKILSKLKRKEMMEVSTGLFVDLRGGPGKHNGKRYKAVAANHKPDHLAILPDSEGACSIADGGGLFQLNAKRESRLSRLEKAVRKMQKHSRNKEFILMKKTGKKISKKEFVSKLIKNELTTFEEADRKWLMNLDPKQLRKMQPKKAAHVFESDEELEEVVNEKIEDRLAEMKRKNKKKELRETNRKEVRNKRGSTEDDSEDDEVEDDDTDEPAKHRKADKKPKPSRKKLKDFLENEVPDELRPILNQALKAAATEEDRLIKTIVANKASGFKAEDLKKLAPRLGSHYLEHLRGLAAMAKNSSDDDDDGDDAASYFGAALPPVNNESNEDEDEGQELPLPTYNNSRFAKGLKLATAPVGGDDDEEEDEMEDE
jgi:hypothetical protein